MDSLEAHVVRFARALGLMLFVLACGDDESARGGAADVPALEPGCDAALEAPLRRWEAAAFSGAVAVVQAERARCLLGLGLADRAAGLANTHDTVFSIGSVSKTFTAATVLALSGAGLLGLDEPVSRWIEDWPEDKRDITIRQLLVHTSGLGSDHGADHVPLTRTNALGAIADQPLLFEPGSDYEYSNTGYTLLAIVSEIAASKPFRSVLQERVTTMPSGRVIGGFWDGEPAPSGTRAVGYMANGRSGFSGRGGEDHWALDGNGSQAMSVEELASWALELSRGAVLRASELDLMLTPMVDLGDGFEEAPGWVAIEPEVLGDPAFASAGGGGDIGHNAVLLWSPPRELILAIVSNAAIIDAEDLFRAILPALLANEPFPTPLETVPLPADAIEPLVGTYTLESGGDLNIAAEDSGIAVTAVGGPAMRVLFPLFDEVEPESIEEHERAAAAFFAGATAEGRREIEGLEADLGSLTDVRIEATMVAAGEVRSYLTLAFENTTLLAWLALSERGTLMALEVDTDWPTLHLSAISEQLVFAPRGTIAGTPHVELTIADDGAELVVVGEEETRALRVAEKQ